MFDYRIKKSNLAKHIRLNITPQDGLVVTVPKGFKQSDIKVILQQKHQWITQHLNEIKNIIQQDFPPDDFNLQAITQLWQIKYTPETGNQKIILKMQDSNQLQVIGDATQHDLLQYTLRDWLKNRGIQYLIPKLRQLSNETQLPIKNITIRGQKTRWGSCSSLGNINLNYKLLFLPPDWVRYVMLHELAHTQHMNHSSAYWQFLTHLEPDCRRLDAALRQAWKYIPIWV